MPLIINTSDNKKIEIDDIKPYIKIKLIMSFLNSEDIDFNEENDNFDMSYDYEFDLDATHSILTKIFDYSKYNYTIKDLNITEQDMYNI